MRQIENVIRAVIVLLMAFAAVLIGTSMSRFQTDVHGAGCGQTCLVNPNTCNDVKACPYCTEVGRNVWVCTGTL